MRLICPNCDAQYEVPLEVMPEDGRDVQCSNCGQTWFQYHPDHLPDPVDDEIEDDDEEVLRADDLTPSDEPRVPDTPDEDVTAAEPDLAPEPEPEPEQEFDPSKLDVRRKPLDPAVADILREEAELEVKARQSGTAGSVESQPDLGLEDNTSPDEASRRATEASDRMARMRGEDPAASESAEAAAAAAALGSRRDLLPDIEEINSTLRSSNDRSAAGDPTELANVEVREKRSFRRGFVMIILIAVLLALLYVFAPAVAEAVPALAAPLEGYVGVIDTFRAWLNGQMSSLTQWLDHAAAISAV